VQITHHVRHCDELRQVHVWGEGQRVVGRVQVDHGHPAAEAAQELEHPRAVGGLAGARRADHRLAEPYRRRRRGRHLVLIGRLFSPLHCLSGTLCSLMTGTNSFSSVRSSPFSASVTISRLRVLSCPARKRAAARTASESSPSRTLTL